MQKDNKSTVWIFFLNGVESLLGWNAVLAALDFFADSFKEYNVYSFMPVPVFAGYLTVAVAYHQTSTHFKQITHIVTGCIVSICSLLFLLAVSLIFEQTLMGFILLMTGSYIVGVGANLTQLTFFGMINYLSQEVVSMFTIGTAASGLFIAITRAILTAIFGSKSTESTATIIYFAVATAFIIVNMFMNIIFCKSQIYKLKIDKFLPKLYEEKDPHGHSKKGQGKKGQNGQIQSKELCLNDPERQGGALAGHQAGQKHKKIEDKIQSQNYFKTLYQIFKRIFPYPLIILVNLLLTFVLFPGPIFAKKVGDFDPTWCVIIYNLAYNVGDTLGKFLPGIDGFFNHKSLLYCFFIRLFFFFPVSVMATGNDQGDSLLDNYFFPFINLFLIALTNGIVTNASFIMAFQVSPLEMKKYAGVLCGLTLQVGIMIGTVLEIPYGIALGIN